MRWLTKLFTSNQEYPDRFRIAVETLRSGEQRFYPEHSPGQLASWFTISKLNNRDLQLTDGIYVNSEMEARNLIEGYKQQLADIHAGDIINKTIIKI